ncbi:hypothetical protein M407DRAFT_30751 [Tulasnella calospora MUT 4182]|uniref:Neutral/alkaline non-lysosomal ceramidase C-terminal domain-containing protein n=1 Tax=Tulasnella calospora MUT 4182 TaxID=1051891 RepID=A0A0C3Q7P4_9AGAM|nr:hypothetical protein M407DRAFT_30751 [Tulasnella calospora MUT 4182]
MAPVADAINAAASNADLGRRGNDGIALTDFHVERNSPTHIKFKWSHHRRSPNRFTAWLRNVKTQEHYRARLTVWTSSGQSQVGLNSIDHKTGEYQLVLTKYNHYGDVYARSETFKIRNNDF